MPLTTGPSTARGISIHYRVLIESAVNESRSRNFLFPYCRKICEVTKARKCNPSQPLEVLILAKEHLSGISEVSVSYFIHTLIYFFVLLSLLMSFETSF